MQRKRIPKVRLAKPAGRPIQLRYRDPETKREIRITTETYDEAEALEQKRKLEAKLLLGIDAKPKRHIGGPSMPWELFRLQYSELHLASLQGMSAVTAGCQADYAEQVSAFEAALKALREYRGFTNWIVEQLLTVGYVTSGMVKDYLKGGKR